MFEPPARDEAAFGVSAGASLLLSDKRANPSPHRFAGYDLDGAASIQWLPAGQSMLASFYMPSRGRRDCKCLLWRSLKRLPRFN